VKVFFGSLILLGSIVAAHAQPVLTLEDAVRMAVKDNRQVQISSLEIAKAVEMTAETRTLRLPQFKTYVLGGSTLNDINLTIPRGALGIYPTVGPIPGKDASVTTSPTFAGLVYGSAAQPVSQLYKIRLGIEAARLGEQFARENLRQKKQETAAQVRQAYYQLVQLQSQIAGGEARVFGVMIESALRGGRQELVQGRPLVYGQSITDGCISWDESVPLLESLAMAVRERRRLRAGAADAERVAAQ